jgi:hypothetical protein
MKKTYWAFEVEKELGYERSDEVEIDFGYTNGCLDGNKRPESLSEALKIEEKRLEDYNRKYSRNRKLTMIVEYDENMCALQSYHVDNAKENDSEAFKEFDMSLVIIAGANRPYVIPNFIIDWVEEKKSEDDHCDPSYEIRKLNCTESAISSWSISNPNNSAMLWDCLRYDFKVERLYTKNSCSAVTEQELV